MYKEAEKKAKEEKAKAEKEAEEKKKSDKKSDSKSDSKKDDKKAETKPEVEPIVIEFDNIEDRIMRLTNTSGQLGSYTADKDAKYIYYTMAYNAGYDLYQHDVFTGEQKVILKGSGSGSFVWDKKMENMFLLGSTMRKFKGTSPTTISARSDIELNSEA